MDKLDTLTETIITDRFRFYDNGPASTQQG